MIYLNNAGTTWPKPPSVSESIQAFNDLSPDHWLDLFSEGIKSTTSFLHIINPDRFLFTQSCTQSITIALSDFPWEKGDRFIISSMEHHALSRWYYKLQNERGIEGVIIPRSTTGPLDLDGLEDEMKKGVRMVAISMASNVTGELLPFEEVIQLCEKYGAISLLDGAQTAGLIPIDISALRPDIFVFAGHKAPFGPQGIGGLYISEKISMVCPSAACEVIPGEKKPTVFPTYCDTGSAPIGAIAGLCAGVKWLEEKGWDELTSHRMQLSDKMRSGLKAIDGIEIVGSTIYGRYTGAVSIKSDRVPLTEIHERLWKENNIRGSFGFQCAPLAHEAVGTQESGTIRFSVGPMNTMEEIDTVLEAIELVTKSSDN